MNAKEYSRRLRAVLAALRITDDDLRRRGLPPRPEPDALEVVAFGAQGRAHRLIPEAALAWRALAAAAATDGVELSIVTAFRTLEEQADIVRGKQAAGLPLDIIFRMSAPPGYSEHHTGRCVDLTTPGSEPLQEAFEATPAYDWLAAHASAFGFTLSYPRGNAHGFMYEPWHWCFDAPPARVEVTSGAAPGDTEPGLRWHETIENVDWEELSALYRAATLGDKPAAWLRTAFSNSRHVRFVRDAGRLIGAGRALADGVDCAYLCDVAVLPPHQGRGLGRELIARLIEAARGHRKILLYAATGREDFYRRLGFRRMNTAMAIFADGETAARRGLVEDGPGE